MQHAQRQIGNRRAHFTAGMLAVGDAYRRTLQIFQRMQHDFAVRTNQHRQAIDYRLIGSEDIVVRLLEGTLLQ